MPYYIKKKHERRNHSTNFPLPCLVNINKIYIALNKHLTMKLFNIQNA